MSSNIERPVISPVLQEKEGDGGYIKVKTQTWRTVALDVATGIFAPIIVSPLVAVVDVAIINSVTGDKTPVLKGIKEGYSFLFKTPHKFFTSAKWLRYTGLCWMVYAGTYSSSNVVTSYIEANNMSVNQPEQAKMLKLVVSSTFNIGLTLVKDVLLVKSMKSMKVPLITRMCFMSRDVLTMGATFIIADEVGRWLAKTFEGTLTARQARVTGTLLVPVSLQPFSTLLHLLGLNIAENQAKPLNASQMSRAIASNYGIATISRMARIFPAIGLGSNINIGLRDANYRRAERNRWL